MKFEDIIIDYLWEQVNHPGGIDPEDPEQIPNQGAPIPPDNDDEDDGNLEIPNDEEPERPEPEHPEDQEATPQPDSRKKVKPTAAAMEISSVKSKWTAQAAQTNARISEAAMDDAISFFNEKKIGLRPLANPPNNLDIPQLFTLQQRFPNFPGSDPSKIKNIQTYSWEQINFLMERYLEGAEEDIPEEIEVGERVQIAGADDLSRFLPKAYKSWEDKRKKLYDANGVTIIQIESQEQSISYGGLQNCLRDKYKDTVASSNYWCTTKIGGSLYGSYRDWRSFYYVLNKNVPESDPYRMFAIGAVRKGDSRYPFTLTDLYNRVNSTSLTFDEVMNDTNCRELVNARDRIVWFEETEKESVERIYDSYTFNQRSVSPDANGNYNLLPSDFSLVKPRAQLRYIQSGRIIKSGKVLKSLGEVVIEGRPVDIQKEYVRNTTAQNFQTRFISSDPDEDDFAMINSLRTSNVTFLNATLQHPANGITDGIYAIVGAILNKNYKGSWKDYSNPKIRVFQSKTSLGIYGVYDLSKYKWIKPAKYRVQPTRFYLNKVDREVYGLIKYMSDDDYFFWLFRKNDLLKYKDKTNPNYLKGKYLEGRDGDELIGRLVKL